MELIDKYTLVGQDGLFSKRGCPGNCQYCGLWSKEGCRVILEAPTVDAVEVVHGHWNRLHFVTEIALPDKYICSECQSILYKEFNYCPECGADMRGNDNG